ncbi:MAG: caspase family protein, partial [Gemmataceae bacterium]
MSDKPAPTPGWMRSQGRRRDGKPDGSRWWTSVILVLVLLGAAVGAIVALVGWREVFNHPRFLPIVISEYPAGVPPRPFGEQDADALLALEWAKKNAARNSQERRLLVAELDTLESADPKTPLVVYVGGYVAFGPADKDKDGEGTEVPYLLPSDGRLEDRSTWVPLARVLGAMQACPAEHKLLLIDVMQPLIWPARGLLRGRVAERVMPHLEQGAVGGLLILTACSSGQVSHTAGELGHSAFGFHLQQGLAGHADRNKDTFISVRELADHVTDGVDKWVHVHRGERQTPRLLGEAADFYLTVQKTGAKEPAGLSEQSPDELRDGWRRHDEWWQRGIDQARRPVFLALGRTLLGADELWRGGRKLDSGFGAALSRRTREYLAQARSALGEELTFAGRLARVPVPPTDPEARKALERAVAQRDRVPPEKPDDAERDRLAAAYKDRPAALAKLVFDVAEGVPFGPAGAGLLA